MRYAIFSDIHGNMQAWNAVLADMYDSDVDVPVCLGDIVGYGPCPQKVLEGIRKVTTNFVMGNHDAAATGVLDPHMFNDKARAVIEWTREQLDEQALEFLRDMPLVIEDGDLMFVHAEIEEPGRFLYIDSEEEALDNFQHNTQRITFVGHTHDPAVFAQDADGTVSRHEDTDCVLSTDQRFIVNVGSVGEPRNPEDIRARYVIFDSDTNELIFRRIEFDVEAYRVDLLASGLTITPYFLTVVDSYREAVAMSQEAQLMRDMRTPVHAPTLLQRRAQSIQTPLTGRPPLRRAPVVQPKDKNFKVIVLVLVSVFLILATVVSIIFFGGESRPDWARNVAITFGAEDDTPIEPLPPEVAPISEQGSGAELRISDDPTPISQLAYWRIDGGKTALLNPLMTNSVIGEISPPLVKKVPRNGAANVASATRSAWKEAEGTGLFSLQRDSSFTVELFFSLKDPDRANFIIGDRTDDTKDDLGWQVIAMPGDRISVLYDPGEGEPLSATVFRPDLFNGDTHHLAVIWNHVDGPTTGHLTVFIDGEAEAELPVPLASIPSEPTGKKFAIGARTTSPKEFLFTGNLDEVRVSAGDLPASHFLMADRKGNLVALNPGTGKAGRKVRIDLSRVGILTLAEVEVMAGGKNVARGGKATQSTTRDSASAERAIDGNKSDLHADGGMTHTDLENNPWWEVNLKAEHTIDSIRIWNRGETFSHRLNNFKISVINDAGDTVFVKEGNNAPEGSIVFDLKQKGKVAYLDIAGKPGKPAAIPSKPEFSEKDLVAKVEMKAPAIAIVETPAPAPQTGTDTTPLSSFHTLKQGLIFYASFDEPAGEKVLMDLSGNGRNMDVGPVKINQPGKAGSSVHFQKNGLTTSSQPFTEAKEMTISFWILPDEEQVAAESPAQIISILGVCMIQYDNEQIGFNLSGENRMNLFPMAPDKKWHHIVLESDDTKTTVVVDGRKYNPIPHGTPRATVSKAQVKLGTGPSRFHLDEVAIWRRILTPEERVALSKAGADGKSIMTAPEVVAHWKFDEEEGKIFNDNGGKFPLGSLTNPIPKDPISPVPVPLTQKPNAGAVEVETLVQPPGADAEPFTMTLKNGFTYEGWFTPTIQKMATMGRTNARAKNAVGWRFALAPEKSGRNGSIIFRYEAGDQPKALAQGLELYDGNPHHFAAVWQPMTDKEGIGKMLIFVDGKEVASTDIPHSEIVDGKSDPLEIGGAGNKFVIDELRFTREPLNPRQFLRFGKIAPPSAAPK